MTHLEVKTYGTTSLLLFKIVGVGNGFVTILNLDCKRGVFMAEGTRRKVYRKKENIGDMSGRPNLFNDEKAEMEMSLVEKKPVARKMEFFS